jgi:hypothetical protein
MARFSSKLTGDLGKAFRAFEAQVYGGYHRWVADFVVDLNARVLAKTPVWEGEVLRNWRWSIGTPDTSAPIAPEGGSILPGPTSTMAIGTEPRYAANAAKQIDEMRGFLVELALTPEPVNIFLTNTASTALLLEQGVAPTPEKTRAPRGILFLSLIETLTAMGAR